MNNSGKWLISVLVLFVAAWALLYKLDAMPMYLWDESRQANNALEMAQSHQYLYTTYQNQPDFWNTKPHLLILIQSFFFQLLGPGLLALRLPSAIAGILTVMAWFLFLQKRNSPRTSILFVFILLTCGGFNTYHITRTGDYDALLLLFFSLALMQWYRILFENNEKRQFYLFYLYIALALLTKSVAVLIWVPAFLVTGYIFYRKIGLKIQYLFRGIWIPILTLLAYYGYREMLTPGYLGAVWENEVAVRYFAPNEGHDSPWYYYFVEIHNTYFSWYWAAAILLAVFLLLRNTKKYYAPLFFGVFSVLFLLTLSSSKTRIHWYMAPVIPCLAAFIALSVEALMKELETVKWGTFVKAISFLVLIYVGIVNWNWNWRMNLNAEGVLPQVVFRDAEKAGKFRYNGTWLLGTYNPLETYYQNVLAKKNIALKTATDMHFKPLDTVYIWRMEQIDSVKRFQYCRQIHFPDPNYPVWVFVVDSLKQIPDLR